MKAKDKANELVDRYLEYVEAYSSQGQLENAKICALIAVEELIEITYAASRSEYEYWLDVKRYIKAIA
jgi:predicted HAD superfamily Cof-like phosphohydrolase